MAKRIFLNELANYARYYVNEAKQAGDFVINRDTITDCVEQCVRQINADLGSYIDKLPEFDDQEVQGYIEEYFAGLVPVSGRILDGSSDELAPARPEFDEAAYSYPLTDDISGGTGLPGVKFKTTVDDNYFERYVKDGNAAGIVGYILQKLYQSEEQFKFDCKKQLLGNFINKACDAQAGTAVPTTALTAKKTLKPGNIYSQSDSCYILNKKIDYAAGATISLSTEVTNGNAKVITPDLKKVIAKPANTATAEAFIKEIKNTLEKLQWASEGTSLSGSTIGAADQSLTLYIKPEIKSVISVDALAGAFNPEELGFGVTVKVLPDFGTTDDANVYAVLVDTRGIRLIQNYNKANSTPINSGLYTNYWLHYGATAWLSKHTAIKVFTTA